MIAFQALFRLPLKEIIIKEQAYQVLEAVFDKRPQKLSALQLIEESNRIPWNQNWGNDVQPDNLEIGGYLALARRFRVQALLTAKNLLEKMPNGVLKDDNATPGFYSLDGRDYNGVKTTPIDQLIKEIREDDETFARWNNLREQIELSHLFNRPRDVTIYKTAITYAFENYQPDTRFLKSEASARRKLADNKLKGEGKDHPYDIGDFLRLQILFDNAHDIALARHTLQFGNVAEITSQKDRLQFPDKYGGHRAFLVHARAYDGTKQFKYEIMIGLFQAETLAIDKNFRDSQRDCDRLVAESTDNPHIGEYYSSLAKGLEYGRRLAMYKLYRDISGMNDMLDASIDPDGIMHHAEVEGSAELAKCNSSVNRMPRTRRALQVLFYPPTNQ
jgi:hypothetical protein